MNLRSNYKLALEEHQRKTLFKRKIFNFILLLKNIS